MSIQTQKWPKYFFLSFRAILKFELQSGSNFIILQMYSIDHKIAIFPCERDFYFFEIIRLENYSSNLISLEIMR